MRLIEQIKGDILKKIICLIFYFPLYSTITRNTLTINNIAIKTNYSYTRIMRAAGLSVYCLALPSLNNIDTCIHTYIHTYTHKLRKVKRSSFGYSCLREVNISGTTRKCRLLTRFITVGIRVQM